LEPRLARRLVAIALLSGLIADLLFDRIAPGLNVPIAVGVALAVTTLVRPRGRAIDPLDWWIPAAAFLAALGVAVRADPLVILADLAVAGVGTVAWAVAVSGGSLTRRSMTALAGAGALAVAWLIVGSTQLLQLALGDRALSAGVTAGRRFFPVLRGLILAIPFVVVFAALLGSADVVFGDLVDDLLTLPVDAEELVRRSVFVAVAAWIIGGGLAIAASGLPGASGGSGANGLPGSVGLPVASVGVSASSESETSVGSAPGTDARRAAAQTAITADWGATEILTVVVAIEVLFAAFVLVQVAYLFGGFATVAAHGLTYSEYARQGFFQLVAVVLGAGALLVLASAISGGHRHFRPVAAGLVVLTAVILVSAALRLTLYQQAYGWTELRFHVAATIGWLAVDLAIALALVLTGRVRWLLHGATMVGVATVLVVTAIGPSSFIAEQNVARVIHPELVPPEGKSGLDVGYVGSLGDGAIPVLVDALPELDEATRTQVREMLLLRRVPPESAATGWAAWNLERERAREALDSLTPGG
jgi:hypothetical protein